MRSANWANFDQLKQYAKRVAKIAFDDKLTKEQIERVYFDVFYPESDVVDCNKLAVMYKDYLLGKVSDLKAEKRTAETARRYADREIFFDKAMTWQKAATKALQESGKEFGAVEFTCPLCSGQAQYSRRSTPRNISHNVTIRGYCRGCDYGIMN